MADLAGGTAVRERFGPWPRNGTITIGERGEAYVTWENGSTWPVSDTTTATFANVLLTELALTGAGCRTR